LLSRFNVCATSSNFKFDFKNMILFVSIRNQRSVLSKLWMNAAKPVIQFFKNFKIKIQFVKIREHCLFS
jgi:hypothetical protein